MLRNHVVMCFGDGKVTRLLILQSVFSVGVTQVRKKDLRDWRKNGGEDRERKCSHKPVKSVLRTMSTRETSSG